MGLPLGVTRTLRIGIYQMHGRNEGSVEVIEYVGTPLDFPHAATPGRGWAALRFELPMSPASSTPPWGSAVEVYRAP